MRNTTIKLKKLLQGIEAITKGSKEIEITGISDDSRTTAPGHLFIARRGSALNGAEFIPQAIASGAHAILSDLYDPFVKATQIIAHNPNAYVAPLASRFYDYPSNDLFVVGTTGTKGKTTTSYMVHHILQGLGAKSGLIGGVEAILGDERRATTLTTHGCIQNQKWLKEMLMHGCKSASLEVSSHGLDQGRVDGIQFDVAIFTNLTPDHLDYHPTMEAYAAAKKLLFTHLDRSSKATKRALLNADSAWCLEEYQSPSWTFGIETPADIMAREIVFDTRGTQFVASFQGEQAQFSLPLVGRFNVYNALGAIGVGLHRGATLSEIAAVLKTFRAVPGRLEQIPNDRGIWVFVDHAHSGEALAQVLQALREIAKKRILCVFGCGGNRDPRRRITTAHAAETYSDVPIITSDNPRSEDPLSICEQIRQAFRDPKKPLMIVDRRAAIAQAIAMAGQDDIVLIAGKGHEKVQIFAHHTIAFDDVVVATEALKEASCARL